MNIGDYIRFNYSELDRFGKPEVNEYSGYVTYLYKNGQFILSGSDGNNPMRFEKTAMR